jgi:hypothetical protein
MHRPCNVIALKMFSSIACVALFMSVGSRKHDDVSFIFLLLVLNILYTYIPAVLYRSALLDAFARDIILLATHFAALYVVSSNSEFYYASSIHTFCFLAQHIADRDGNGRKLGFNAMTIGVLGYVFVTYVPITSVRDFVFSAVWPHAVHLIAFVIAKLYVLIVIHSNEI